MIALVMTLLAAAPEKLIVADVRVLDAELTPLAEKAQERLATGLSQTGRFDVLSSTDLRDLLGLERQKQLAGCGAEAGTSCMAEISAALGAPWLVASTLQKGQGALVRLDVKLIFAEKGTVISREGGEVPAEELPRLVRAAVDRFEQAMRDREGPSRLGPAIAMGAGGAGLAVGVALLAMIPGQRAALQSEVPSLTADVAQQRQQALAGQGTLGLALTAAGAAVGAAGVTWWFLQPARPAGSASLYLVPAPNGVVAGGAF